MSGVWFSDCSFNSFITRQTRCKLNLKLHISSLQNFAATDTEPNDCDIFRWLDFVFSFVFAISYYKNECWNLQELQKSVFVSRIQYQNVSLMPRRRYIFSARDAAVFPTNLMLLSKLDTTHFYVCRVIHLCLYYIIPLFIFVYLACNLYLFWFTQSSCIFYFVTKKDKKCSRTNDFIFFQVFTPSCVQTYKSVFLLRLQLLWTF